MTQPSLVDQAVQAFGKQTFPKAGFETWMHNCLHWNEVEPDDLKAIQQRYREIRDAAQR